MTDRTVVYRLQADVKQFQAQMAAAGASARKAAGDLGTSLQGGGSKASAALDGLGINAGTVALAVGTTIVMASANFEKAMSGIQAATHESAAGMDALRDAALEAGATTSFSATEAAAGIENLAKAGLSTQDILGGGLAGALDLAAAGNMEVADAAEAAAGALAQFKLEGDEASHVADLLAAGAGKAQGDVSDMVMALKQAGTVSAQTGLSLEETTGALAAMAEQSLLGSDAGTSFKTFLAALTPNSKKAADAMAAYNIQAYDAQGNFVGMTALAGQLEAGLSGLTDEQRAMALETIFGSDAVRAASIIYDNGAEGIAKWTANVNDAGYAAETAAIQLNNLQGDVEALKGALETAFIEGGDDSQGALRGITQLATDTVNLTSEAEKADGVLGSLWSNVTGAINPIGRLGDTYHGLKGAISGTDEKAEDLDKTSQALTQSTGGLAGSTDSVMEAMTRATEETESFKDMLDRLNGVLEGRADMRDYEAAIDDFTKSLKDNGKTFDINTEKGRNNQAALDNIASSALAVAENMRGAARTKFLTTAIADIRTMGDQMGLPKREVNALIALLREANNTNVKPEIDADTTAAMSAIERVRNAMLDIKDKSVTIRVTQTGAGLTPGFGPQAKADGGLISGPGTGTSDSIPAYLSNGEYVVKAAAVEKYGSHMFDRLNAMHFASGGKVEKGKKKRNASAGFDSALDFGPSEQAQMMAAEAAEQYYAAQALAQQEAERRAEEAARLAEEEAKRRKDYDDAVLAGHERAWEQASREGQERVDLAQRELSAVESSMSRIGDAATSAFNSPLFSRDQKQQSGLSVGAGGSGWLAAITGDIAGLQERSGLISQLSSQGLSGSALEALLGQSDNAGISAMLANGEISNYAALFAQREALKASVGQQAGVAGYGAEYAAASVEMAQMNAQFAALTAAIQAARPITVLESVSAEATAAEIARLMSMVGAA